MSNKLPPIPVRPGSMWLVVTDCRYDVVRVACDGSGYFIPGQEPCWKLENAAEWIAEIHPPKEGEATALMRPKLVDYSSDLRPELMSPTEYANLRFYERDLVHLAAVLKWTEGPFVVSRRVGDYTYHNVIITAAIGLELPVNATAVAKYDMVLPSSYMLDADGLVWRVKGKE